MKHEDLRNTIFDVEVSAFKNCFHTESKTVNLSMWLTSNKYESEQIKLRAIADKKERDKIKIQLPAITPSALLISREKDLPDNKKLVKYSGFMQIDIDFKDNVHLTDYNDLLQKLPLIKNIAYCGKSASGNGYYCLVPIAQPDKLALHFLRFKELLQTHFNIILDSSKGGNFTDLRIYSYTQNAYFNIDAKPFNLLYQPKPIKKKNNAIGSVFTNNKFELVLQRHNLTETFTEGNQNNYLVKLSGYCNAKGLDINETINGCIKLANDEYTEKRIIEIVRSVYAKHSSKHNSHPFSNRFETKKEKLKEAVAAVRQISDKVGNVEHNTIQPFEQPEQSKHDGWQQYEQPKVEPITTSNNLSAPEIVTHDGWQQDIAELENYFASIELPTQHVMLNSYSKIINCSRFIKSHLDTVKANNGKQTFLPYLNRLQELKQVLTTNIN